MGSPYLGVLLAEELLHTLVIVGSLDKTPSESIRQLLEFLDLSLINPKNERRKEEDCQLWHESMKA